jgi:squalene cyclase
MCRKYKTLCKSGKKKTISGKKMQNEERGGWKESKSAYNDRVRGDITW